MVERRRISPVLVVTVDGGPMPIETELSVAAIRIVSIAVARFCSLMVERDLFGTVRLMRNGGRIGTTGRELAEEFGTKLEARQALEALARAKRRRGYWEL